MKAAKVIHQLLCSIKHLHDNNICHRDIKLENLLFESSSAKKEMFIKLIDFGLSKYTKSDQEMMTSEVGTPSYLAPE